MESTVDHSSSAGEICKNVNKTQDIDILKINESATEVPCFVPDAERNACFIKKCNFIAPSAVDLLVHISHHHKGITSFKCSHCSNCCSLPIMKMMAHLAMHGKRLYKCNLCTFHHFNHGVVGDHIKQKHPTCRVDDIKEVRNLEVESKHLQVLKSEAKISSDEMKKWQCGFCDFYSPKYLAHATQVHNIKYQFKCTLCSVHIPSKNYVDIHCSIRHPDTVVTLVAFYYQVGSTLPIRRVEVIMPDGQNVFSHESATFAHKKPGAPLRQYLEYYSKDEACKRKGLEDGENEDPKDNENEETGVKVEGPVTGESKEKADNLTEAAGRVEKSLNVEKRKKIDECGVVRKMIRRSEKIDDDISVVAIRRSLRTNKRRPEI